MTVTVTCACGVQSPHTPGTPVCTSEVQAAHVRVTVIVVCGVVQPKYEGEFKKDLLKTWAESRMTPLVAKFGQ